jgi:hypothetical protein
MNKDSVLYTIYKIKTKQNAKKKIIMPKYQVSTYYKTNE